MEEIRKMTKGNIDVQLRRFLKQHIEELTIVSRNVGSHNIINFEVNITENYEGKGKYLFIGKIEILNKNGFTERLPIKGDIYIEEDGDNGPKFSEVGSIYPYF